MRIILATNTAKTKVTKANGKYQITGIPITVDNAVMNKIKYTAEELGLSRQALYRRIEKYQLGGE